MGPSLILQWQEKPTQKNMYPEASQLFLRSGKPNWKANAGNSLVDQWLGLGAFTATAQVQSLVGELRSCKPCGKAKKKKKEEEEEEEERKKKQMPKKFWPGLNDRDCFWNKTTLLFKCTKLAVSFLSLNRKEDILRKI